MRALVFFPLLLVLLSGGCTATDYLNIIPRQGENLKPWGTLNRKCLPNHASASQYNVAWILPNGEVINSENLEINNLGWRDSGKYICRAVSWRSRNVMESEFDLNVAWPQPLSPPLVTFSRINVLRGSATLWVTTLPDEDMRVGGTVSQRCNVDPSGWDISWKYPNGNIIHGKDLRIPNLSRREYGRYWCIARNRETKQEVWGWYEMDSLRDTKG